MSLHAAVLSFAAVALLLTIIPGMDSAIVLRSAISQGRGPAYATALGVSSGALVWGVTAAVGASAVLAASHDAYTVLKLAGAAYMIWLGASMLWDSRRMHTAARTAAPKSSSLRSAWLRGFGTNLLNPKVGVFYLAMIPQFMAHGVSPLVMGIVLATVHNLIALFWFTGIITAAVAARRLMSGERFARIVDRVTGSVLVAFGLRLAATTR